MENLDRMYRDFYAFVDSFVSGAYKAKAVSIHGEEMLDSFVEDEFGARKGKQKIVMLLRNKLPNAIKRAVNHARKNGLPVVPVNEDFFSLTTEQINGIELTDDAKQYMPIGQGNKSVGCKLIYNDSVDPFFNVWHDFLTLITNGNINAVKEIVNAGTTQKLPGYSGRSSLVKETNNASLLPSPDKKEDK